MINVKRAAVVVALGQAFLGSSTVLAHAYLDPGTGSLFLQMLIGAIAGGILAIKMYWAKVKMLFTRRARGRPKTQRHKAS